MTNYDILTILKRLLNSFNCWVCSSYLQIKKQKNHRRFTKEMHEEHVIISMTSWKMRIGNVPLTVDSLLRNTIIPNQIVLNLSIEEFPLRERNLPQELLNYVNDGIVEILWQKGNTKSFKKIIPTLQKYPFDIIIAIDDDFIYPSDFIETFVKMHQVYPCNPLSGNHAIVNETKAHCGCSSLVKSEFFGQYIEELIDEKIIEIGMDDVFYTFCAALNKAPYLYVGKLFYFNMLPNNPIESLSAKSKYNNFDMSNYLIEKIHKKYKINASNLSRLKFWI